MLIESALMILAFWTVVLSVAGVWFFRPAVIPRNAPRPDLPTLRISYHD